VGAPFTDHPTKSDPFAVTVTAVPEGKYDVQIACACVQMPPEGVVVMKSAGLSESTSTESGTPVVITLVDTGPELPTPVRVAVFERVPVAVGTIVKDKNSLCPAPSEIVHVIEVVPVQPEESDVALKPPGKVSVTVVLNAAPVPADT